MLTRLAEITTLVRSKNAGPFGLTFDIMFKEQRHYELAKAQRLIHEELVRKLYRPVGPVSIYYYDTVSAVKISFARPCASGSVRDRDVFGAQQYAPLLDLQLDIECPDW